MGDLLGEFGDDADAPTDVPGLLDAPPAVSEPPAGAGSSLDGMLAGSDDDDLFGAQPPAPEPAAAQPTSALVQWQRAKDTELQEKDARDDAASGELKAKARDALTAFNKTIAEGQEKRRVHNAELDAEKTADLQANFGNQWEKVVKFIDFNRSDLHERDVAKFKTLLLQLKH
jgi:hypothetical protein